MKRALIVAIVALSIPVGVSARSKKVTLTIHSMPEGAILTENGKVWGATPFALTYELPDSRDCTATKPTSVRWASGAEASVPYVSLCHQTGKNQQFTFARPADVDGLAIDLQVAYQQAMLAQMRAQTAALDYDGWLQTLHGSQRAAAAPKPFALCITRDVARGVIYVACQ